MKGDSCRNAADATTNDADVEFRMIHCRFDLGLSEKSRSKIWPEFLEICDGTMLSNAVTIHLCEMRRLPSTLVHDASFISSKRVRSRKGSSNMFITETNDF